MYELSRVRLYSVGPPGARYEDVTIDLSEAGQSIAQQHLLLLDDRAPLLRPSPATVLFLENGGGKSVLMKLIFSVVLPGKRQIVGTSNTRVLEKFVARGDVAHVVLEWMHTETGRPLVIGKISHWQQKKNNADDGMAELWYSMRPTPSIGLATLPFAEDGDNLSANEFRARLSELADDDPTIELFWADRHNKWETRLTTLGLDPELFEFQRRMNSGEGEAAEAFTFKTDEALIDFLLKAVLPEADAISFAESFEEYASRLSERDVLELEREFVAAALDKLKPLGEQHREVEAAQQNLAVRQRDLNGFVASIIARISYEQDKSAAQRKDVELAAAKLEAARTEHDLAVAIHAELTRRHAGLRVEEATLAFDSAENAHSAAVALVDGWQAAEPFIEWSAKDRAACQLEEVLDEKQNAAAIALRRRDTQATALVRALRDVIDSAKRTAADDDKKAAQLTDAAAQAQRLRDAAVANAAAAKATAEELRGRIQEVKAETELAIQDGLLRSAESVPTEVDALIEAARAAAGAVTQQEILVKELDGALDTAQAELVDARGKVNKAEVDHGTATTLLDHARAAASALTDEPRLAELTDAADIVLESDLERLVEALTEALSVADRERTALSVGEAADERARHALDSGEDALYPPPPEIEELVALLRDEEVRCYSGWDVLADIPDENERHELVTRLPHLASGVLLNDPAEVDRAARILAEHGFEATYLITVASTQSFALDTPARYDLTPTGDAGFAVAPNRALYDHGAARSESERINERHRRRQEQITALTERCAADEHLKARLIRWREEYPPGRLGELAGQLSTAINLLEKARETFGERTEAAGEAKRVRDRAREDLAKVAKAAHDAEGSASRGKRLRDRVIRTAEWATEAETAETKQLAEATLAEQQQELRETHETEARGHQRAADQQRATIQRLLEEISDIGGNLATGPEAEPSADSVPVLRKLLREAEVTFLNAKVGSDFIAEVTAAKQAAGAAWKVFDRFSEAARSLAEQLVATSDGADTSGRSAALDRARHHATKASQDRDQALRTVTERKTWLAGLPGPSQPVTLPVELQRIEEAERLRDEAAAAVGDAVRAVRRSEEEHGAVEAALGRTEQIVAGFVRITDNLVATDDEPVLPAVAARYEGDAESAWLRYGELRKVLNEGRKKLADGRRTLTQAAEALRTSVSEPRFGKLVSAVRTQIIGVAASELSGHADGWSAALHPRLRSITEDLAQSERNRAVLVNRLSGMVDNALRTLRQAQRLSRLPAGLGEWSGEEFLRFTFTAIEGDVLSQQLSQVIDEAARRAEAKRDGMAMLLRGVRAAAPRGFKVTMLKPDAVLRTERVRVSEVHDVFSGGQHLTAAIMLYCTLAALRANNQGKVSRRHSGVLFLDNPIGRASAAYLLDLQRGVAAALGVQLVYTTGLFDAEALGAFPLIVRLRNDADLRAGRKYLSVDRRVKRLLTDIGKEDSLARVTATRVVIKERARAEQS